MNLDWDDELPDEENKHWWSWFQQLDDLRKFSLPRCFLSKELGPITDYQIHHFSDASISGYGLFCIYESQILMKKFISVFCAAKLE